MKKGISTFLLLIGGLGLLLVVTPSAQASPLSLLDGTVTANYQDSCTGDSQWFGESVTTLTIDAQNVGTGQHVEITGSITGISDPHDSYVEIGLIPKATWDDWQTDFGGAFKSAVFNKGIYVTHWSDDGLGLSLEENSSHTGPYAWPLLLSPPTSDPWAFTIQMHPTSSGNAYLSVTGEVDTDYWNSEWGDPVLNIYDTQPFPYTGDYSECYLIAQIWSDTQNGSFSFTGVQATVVPIPASVLLLASGLLGLIGIRRWASKD